MRALVLSDIHANLEALTAVLEYASAPRQLFDTVWNLGDTVGYGASPNQVIDRIEPLASLTVRGNHDRVCCGLSSPVNFNPIARAAVAWTRNELSAASLDWLRSLPQGPLHPRTLQTHPSTTGPVEVLLIAGSTPASDPVAPLTSDPDFDPRGAAAASPIPLAAITCAHGSPLHEDHYVITLRDAWGPLQQTTSSVTFIGHTHLQGGFALFAGQPQQPSTAGSWQELRPRFHSRSRAESWAVPLQGDFRYMVNPGSVGQPRDGDWRAAFAIYDDQTSEITFFRVPYDLTAAQGRILMAGLPEHLAARLREGR